MAKLPLTILLASVIPLTVGCVTTTPKQKSTEEIEREYYKTKQAYLVEQRANSEKIKQAQQEKNKALQTQRSQRLKQEAIEREQQREREHNAMLEGFQRDDYMQHWDCSDYIFETKYLYTPTIGGNAYNVERIKYINNLMLDKNYNKLTHKVILSKMVNICTTNENLTLPQAKKILNNILSVYY